MILPLYNSEYSNYSLSPPTGCPNAVLPTASASPPAASVLPLSPATSVLPLSPATSALPLSAATSVLPLSPAASVLPLSAAISALPLSAAASVPPSRPGPFPHTSKTALPPHPPPPTHPHPVSPCYPPAHSDGPQPSDIGSGSQCPGHVTL